MQAEVILAVEADHGAQRQFCHVEMGRDFFGDWVIAFRRGRQGTRGRRHTVSTNSLERAWDVVIGRLSSYQTECLRKGATGFWVQAVPDMSIPAWANAPLLPWSRLAPVLPA